MTDAEKQAKAIQDALEAEEKKKADAKARADAAETGQKLDKVLSAVDAMCKRIDALEDARGESRVIAADGTDGESTRRKDGERKPTDDDRMDEEEMAAADGKSGGSLNRADATRRLEGHLAKAQFRADDVTSAFGQRAPFPLSGEGLFAYRRRLLRNIQHHSPEFKDVDLGAIRDRAVFAGIETRIYADAAKAGATPVPLPNGELREIVRTNETTGQRIVEFHGAHSFVKRLTPLSRRVTAFNTPNFGSR